jgi:molybdopterin synthase catalytic subunit
MISEISLPRSLRHPPHPGDHFAITFAPLCFQTVYGLADDPANGAIVVMSGMVRNNTGGEAVIALEYQAYEPMALQVFQQIATEMRQRWSDVTHVVIHHRTGRLEIGEISVLIAVGCPHRSEAFAACQYAIDSLKQSAPIWKKEYFRSANGQETWKWANCC